MVFMNKEKIRNKLHRKRALRNRVSSFWIPQETAVVDFTGNISNPDEHCCMKQTWSVHSYYCSPAVATGIHITMALLLQQHKCWTRHYTHTHPFNGPFSGLPKWAGTRKVKPIWILLKQETVSSSGISWDICKSAPRFRQITMPVPHRSSFLRTGCPSCRPTNSVKALKARTRHWW